MIELFQNVQILTNHTMSLKIQFSPHPFLLAKGIRITKLKRRRRVWAFLPSDYFQNKSSHYPVIYFNEGQNVFEGWKSAFGTSWEAHLTMQGFAKVNIQEHILIGVEHGKKFRKKEYLPYNYANALSFEGNVYSDFLANDLKEFVDKNLRTLPQREHTSIIGSSLGGLSALFTGIKHQDVFSKIGVLSPSLWAAPQIYSLIEQVGQQYATKFYMSVGSKEGKYNIEKVNHLHNTFLASGFEAKNLEKTIIQNGTHSEHSWQHEFYNFYQWMNAHS